MIRTRLGLLGLCAVVLGLMAFGTTAAQAEVGAKWLFAQKGGSELFAFLEASIGAEAETTQVLHSKIAGVAVLWECKKLATVNTKLTANGSISKGKIKYSECHTFLNGVLSIPCLPIAGGTQPDVIETLDLHGLIVLHELASGVKDDIVKILPVSGEVFAHIEMGDNCAIGENVLVLGSATLKDCENLALTHFVKHLVEVGPLTELWTISKTAEHIATVLGSAWTFLTGAHEGFKWSGDPA
jgi:hypothetical protein